MRLATYNVHDCVGRDGRFDPKRIAAVLIGLEADLIALQEVTVDHAGTLTKLFETETGMRSVDGSLFARGVGRYGNLILTGKKIVEVWLHDLSCAQCEPRGCIEIELETDDGSLTVFSTHLGLKKNERSTQMLGLSDLLGGRSGAVVLMGDLNFLARAPGLRALTSMGFRHLSVRSFPTWPTPMLTLDRILARPPATIERCWRYDTPLARQASDHFPILAELRIGFSTVPGNEKK